MPDLPSFRDLFRVARDEVLARNPRISKEAVEREGMDANILVAAACAAADEVVAQLEKLEAALFLNSAAGDALARLVFDRYGLVRKAAACSLGTVQFSTTAPSPTTFEIPLGTTVQTGDGLQFITTESTIFPVGSTGPVTIAVRSVIAGRNQNAGPKTIVSISSTISSAPSDLTVSNPLATAGGDDEEADESLRERGRRFFISARRGTLAAIESAALEVDGVRTAHAFEAIDALGRPARLVQLVVSDAFTQQFATLDSVPGRYATQSQQIAAAVFDALADVRPAGTYVQTYVASVVLQPVQIALVFTAGANVSTTTLEARAAIVSCINAMPPGKSLDEMDLLLALNRVQGLVFPGTHIASPMGSIEVKPLQVLRTTLALVSAFSGTDSLPITNSNNPDAYLAA